ncbi:hypothetical protein O181_014848 [Austropuccinia psidii MF-1]|uniref:NTF2 domain-containing protein n=1 Tax=Austropuccinia psidii MF-1 TaxID=1389203 RepID=A0A9Q3GPE6_9BASI|nr:hypothetical protein [Austropuccinia psidii MF-1]
MPESFMSKHTSQEQQFTSSSSNQNFSNKTAATNFNPYWKSSSKREDFQPNESSSWLPSRLRRPVQPPTVKPASLSNQNQSNSALVTNSNHHSTDNLRRPYSSSSNSQKFHYHNPSNPNYSNYHQRPRKPHCYNLRSSKPDFNQRTFYSNSSSNHQTNLYHSQLRSNPPENSIFRSFPERNNPIFKHPSDSTSFKSTHQSSFTPSIQPWSNQKSSQLHWSTYHSSNKPSAVSDFTSNSSSNLTNHSNKRSLNQDGLELSQDRLDQNHQRQRPYHHQDIQEFNSHPPKKLKSHYQSPDPPIQQNIHQAFNSSNHLAQSSSHLNSLPSNQSTCQIDQNLQKQTSKSSSPSNQASDQILASCLAKASIDPILVRNTLLELLDRFGIIIHNKFFISQLKNLTRITLQIRFKEPNSALQACNKKYLEIPKTWNDLDQHNQLTLVPFSPRNFSNLVSTSSDQSIHSNSTNSNPLTDIYPKNDSDIKSERDELDNQDYSSDQHELEDQKIIEKDLRGHETSLECSTVPNASLTTFTYSCPQLPPQDTQDDQLKKIVQIEKSETLSRVSLSQDSSLNSANDLGETSRQNIALITQESVLSKNNFTPTVTHSLIETTSQESSDLPHHFNHQTDANSEPQSNFDPRALDVESTTIINNHTQPKTSQAFKSKPSNLVEASNQSPPIAQLNNETSPPISTPGIENPSNVLWVKAFFNNNVSGTVAQDFIRHTFEQFGKILMLQFRHNDGLCRTYQLEFASLAAAEKALKIGFGYMLPIELSAESKSTPRYLLVSPHRVDGISCLTQLYNKVTKEFFDKMNSNKMSNGAGFQSLTSSSESKSAEETSLSPTEGLATSSTTLGLNHNNNRASSSTNVHLTLNESQLDRSENFNRPSSVISMDTTISKDPLVESVTEFDQTIKEAELPVEVTKHQIPENCKQTHQSCTANRLRFKLDKIRAATSQDYTVLDSVWGQDYLMLYLVPNSRHSQLTADKDQSHNDIDGTYRQTSPRARSATLDNLQPVTSCNPDRELIEHVDETQSCSSAVASSDILVTTNSSNEKHPTWPMCPKSGYLDESSFGDFRKTLNDFLSTFFRLWEESRSDLRYLYDQSAVFSNILAKQGRKASAVTKSTGWPSIYKSISRLPALSNDPIEDLILDSWPMTVFPLRALCVVHGTFSEFPREVKRAFDRTFVLRPVDVLLYPSEGCLGLLKWIIVSDTLTIRKHSARTTAVIEGLRKQEKEYASEVVETNQVSNLIVLNSQCDNSLAVDVPQDIVGRHSPQSTLSTSSPIRAASPPALGRLDSNEPIIQLDTSPSPPLNKSDRLTNEDDQADLESILEPPVTELVEMKSQLRALQAEVEQLKKSTPTAKEVSVPISQSGLASSQASRKKKKALKVSDFIGCSHHGLGAFKKRLLIPTNLAHYLVVSARGDVLAWDKKNRSKVELILEGASSVDLVDSASFSVPFQTLIIGYRPSPSSRSKPISAVSLVHLKKSSSGSLICQKLRLHDSELHKNGVRATCVLPRSSSSRGPLSFVTAGQENHLVIWTTKKLAKPVVTHKILTEHNSNIQILESGHENDYIFSGGLDGQVYATNIHSKLHTLVLSQKHSIFDIQLNSTNHNNLVVTTSNKSANSQFWLFDIRTSKPTCVFGFSSSSPSTITRTHRKGSLKGHLFSYPIVNSGNYNHSVDSGVNLWDLRYLSKNHSNELIQIQTDEIVLQPHFESLTSMTFLGKNSLKYCEF